jgi:dihydroorotase
MTTNELLKQVRLLDPVSQTDQVVDILITEGRVQTLAETVTDDGSDTKVTDSQGLVLGPGLVDLYSHSGEPGFEERETIFSLRKAAAAGGFTRVAVLPDTQPVMDNLASLTWFHDQQPCQQELCHRPSPALPRLTPWAALTLGCRGEQMTELGELTGADIVGFADGKALNNLVLVRRLLEYLRPLGHPIALWACDEALSRTGVVRDGLEALQFGLPGIPAIAETAALAALLACVEETGAAVHLMRLSTARGVELIRQAKARQLPITASTTWMHLILDTADLGSYDPNLHLSPPLGNPADRLALIQAIQDGTLDAIAIDHSPHTYEDKTVAFAEAPPGAIGLELALPLLWQGLVATGQLSALQLWRALSTGPALCLQQKPAQLCTRTVDHSVAPCLSVEWTLFDPQATWIADTTSLQSRSCNTPWLGQSITGRVLQIGCPTE